MTQTSQTVTALMEARFQGLEMEMHSQKEHQTHMDQRLSHLKNRTSSINDNITAMMAHWQITPSQKRRAMSVMHGHNQQPILTSHLGGDGETPQDTNSDFMDNGEMEE
jgi:hypothetical protein